MKKSMKSPKSLAELSRVNLYIFKENISKAKKYSANPGVNLYIFSINASPAKKSIGIQNDII